MSVLKGKTFSVNLNGIQSASSSVPSSVPQKSLLGPWMYIIYANDIANFFPLLR